MPHKKLNLPEKMCCHCLRSFSWRKKWRLCWEDVKYCSKACRQSAKTQPTSNLCAAGQVDDEF